MTADLNTGADPTVSTKIDMDESDRLAAAREIEQTVYNQCIKYGDFSLFEQCPELTRQDLQNADFLTIHPEDLVNINEPDEGWKGYWFLSITDNPMSLRDKLTLVNKMGYQVANREDGFRSRVFEMYPDGVFHYGPLILLVQRSRQYKQHQATRNMPAKHLIDASREAFHRAVDDVSGAGVGSFEAESDSDNTISQDALRAVVRPGR